MNIEVARNNRAKVFHAWCPDLDNKSLCGTSHRSSNSYPQLAERLNCAGCVRIMKLLSTPNDVVGDRERDQIALSFAKKGKKIPHGAAIVSPRATKQRGTKKERIKSTKSTRGNRK